ncbi:hypothetical protein ID866_827 [Astraeus odoratus]|nr:hypothetical protein ID866_827 [Astraeus odoratus]
MDSLRISKLYQFSELSPIFRACGKPQYFAQLESTEICDEVLIQGLRHHMITQQQIAMIPLSLDGVDVALLVIFPADFTGLTMFLCIPKDQVPSDSVLVALIPFSITALSSVKAGEKPVQAIQSLHPNLGKYHFLQKKPVIYQAIFSLGVPTPLLEFLDYPNRTYGIWFSSSDCGQSTSGVETSLLQLVLGSTKATLSHLKDEVRVIFIHVGSLPTIRSLPSLVAKLSDTPETQFFTYGTHPNVDSQRWGFHEIFPLGGIVTFTAGVLAEDPVGCCHVMSKLAEHPTWECFVTPNALAGGDLLAADSNPSSLSCMEPILGLIDSGQVALIRPSGLDRGNGHPWLSSFIRDCTLSNREILEACAANLKASGLSVAQLRSTINEELVKDMSKIQLQPVFMDQYRRFVIIKAASEASIPADKDGFEWCSLSSFSFKDDFFES